MDKMIHLLLKVLKKKPNNIVCYLQIDLLHIKTFV